MLCRGGACCETGLLRKQNTVCRVTSEIVGPSPLRGRLRWLPGPNPCQCFGVRPWDRDRGRNQQTPIAAGSAARPEPRLSMGRLSHDICSGNDGLGKSCPCIATVFNFDRGQAQAVRVSTRGTIK